jgi:ABC-2 type transport system ATP-binding protein
MIELINIKKTGIIEGINIKVPNNSKVALTGNNGTGKTTLLHLLSGVFFPDLGAMKIEKETFDFPLKLLKCIHYLKFLRNKILFIEDTNIFYEGFTMEQNLKYFISMDSYDTEKIWELYSLFNINENPSKVFKNISKGTKQKMTLVLALSSKKDYILLDEPTLGLDNKSKLLFYDLIKSLNKTIIISTHDLEQVSDFDLTYNF